MYRLVFQKVKKNRNVDQELKILEEYRLVFQKYEKAFKGGDLEQDTIIKERTVLIWPAIVTFLAGVIAYFISQFATIAPWTDIFINAGNVLFTIAIGTLILEYFGFIDYMRNRLKDVLIRDDYLDLLNEEKIKALKEKLDRKIIFKNMKDDDCLSSDGLYHVVLDKLQELLTKVYLKSYNIRITCKLEDGLIKKTHFRKQVFAQLDQDKETNIFESDDILFATLKKIDGKNYFNLTKFIFSGDDLLKDVKVRPEPNSKGGPYDTDMMANIETIRNSLLLNRKSEVTLITETEVLTPFDDNTVSLRVNRPCEKMCIDFIYDPDEIEIKGESFGFMASPVEPVVNNNLIEFEFSRWLLPGEGVNFTIKVKKNN